MNIYENRKDSTPNETIKRIKHILKINKIKFKEYGFKKAYHNIFYGRIIIQKDYGTNGKGLTKDFAKASAYAELIERLQTNMLGGSRYDSLLSNIDRKNEYVSILLKGASPNYIKNFKKLDDSYFIIDKMLNLKDNTEVKVPLNLINSMCHTNGLASGNTKSEAITQAIFEILERYCYKTLLHGEFDSKCIINYEKFISSKVKNILDELRNDGFLYEIKDCSLGKYPAVGFILYDANRTKYCYTVASDLNFNIALSRAITEMFQGFDKYSIVKKMKNINLNPNNLNKVYKKNYYSFNWLKCFNYNDGLITPNMFNKRTISFHRLPFNKELNNNSQVLNYMLELINKPILVKDYNKLGFETVRVYIPGLSEIDCFDEEDLKINLNFKKLRKIYCNILNASEEEIHFFIDNLIDVCKCVKYNTLIFPKDVFKIKVISNFYSLSFTSLLIVLMILTKRYKELIKLLEYQIANFPLTNSNKCSYEVLIQLLNDNDFYDKNYKGIIKFYKKIIRNPYNYLKSLKPKKNDLNEPIFNKLGI